MTEINETIVDSSKPNAGRIYDYLIGGSHHFEVDRIAAEKVVEIMPFLPKALKLVRMFLQEAIERCSKWGFTQFIDFASGLPVEDHIHSNTPEGTKVIYSDNDPVTVQYGKNLLGDNPNVKFELCDAATPEILLESDVVKTLFMDNHIAAIGFTGVTWFLTDEQVRHAMKKLYDWADEGAMVYISGIDNESKTEMTQATIDIYKNMNQPIYIRTKEQFSELLKPWKVEEPGFLPFEEWIKVKVTVTNESQELMGGRPFGGFLKK